MLHLYCFIFIGYHIPIHMDQRCLIYISGANIEFAFIAPGLKYNKGVKITWNMRKHAECIIHVFVESLIK